MSTSYHPQTDGCTDRANRSIAQVLRSMVNPRQTDWVARIPMTEFVLNASINESTGFTPFELDGGYMPSMIREIPAEVSVSPGVTNFANAALENLAAAHDSIIESRVFVTPRLYC